MADSPSAPSDEAPEEGAERQTPAQESPEQTPQEPRALSVLPLRKTVMLPGGSAPLIIGRPASLASVLHALAQDDGGILLANQRNPQSEDVNAEDLHSVGVLARLVNPVRMENGVRVTAEVEARVRITDVRLLEDDGVPRLVGQHQPVGLTGADAGDEDSPLRNIAAAMHTLREQFAEYARQDDDDIEVPHQLLELEPSPDNLQQLIDGLGNRVSLEDDEKLALLQIEDLGERTTKLIEGLERRLELRKVERRLRGRVKKQIEKGQREYFLSEQIKAAQKELGQGDGLSEVERYRQQIKAARMPRAAREKALEEVTKLMAMPSASAEASAARAYLGWMLDMPWKKRSKLQSDLARAEQVLDEDHYGLRDVKDRILEYLAVQNRVKRKVGSILCLVGPPGVGKTSLGVSIARATGRKYVRLALGGVRDEAEIRGHRRTYVGSMPGRILQRVAKAGKRNPLFLLDEVDKMGMDWRGDPASALLEVLDPEQNRAFADHFLEVDYDLSEVMFLCTANSEAIPPALHDRMEIIRLPGYTLDEKVNIAFKHLIPKQSKRNGLREGEVQLTEDAVSTVIQDYTREAGVRSLERELVKMYRKVVLEHDRAAGDGAAVQELSKADREAVALAEDVPAERVAEPQGQHTSIASEDLPRYLGPRRYERERLALEPAVGQIRGMAWTTSGGELLTVEAACVAGGKGQLIKTGSLGEVMQESVQAALTVARNRTRFMPLVEGFPDQLDLHIHVPSGATPKDGPSAGLAMTLALASAICALPLRADIAVTGEITLRGDILRIGGLKEKLLAAQAAGASEVLIPAENAPELEEIPQNVKESLQIHTLKSVDEAWSLAFGESWSQFAENFHTAAGAPKRGTLIGYPARKGSGRSSQELPEAL